MTCMELTSHSSSVLQCSPSASCGTQNQPTAAVQQNLFQSDPAAKGCRGPLPKSKQEL